MKILQINSICGIRSTGRICTDIAEKLNADGHECIIAYGREPVPGEHRERTVRIGSNPDVYRHAASSLLFDSAGFGSRSATYKFIDWIEAFDPDIIHLHSIHGYYINIEILFDYLARANKKVVWTLHDCWAFTGHCPYFTAVHCERWKTGCHDCSQKTKYPMSYVFDRSKRNWNRKKELFTAVDHMTIVTPSRWLAGLAGESFLGKYPIRTIGNGVDTGIFKPEPSDFRERYSLTDKRILLGVASVWEERKGLKDFIKLSKMLDGKSRMVIAGLSKFQMAAMPKEILCIGRTDNPGELARLYSAADVYLNLTYEDNYPTTNLEAQACGTPVITYHSGGSLETIHSGDTDHIAAGDITGVYNAINNLKCKSRDALKNGAISALDKNRMIIEYIDIYRIMQEKYGMPQI
jgi:putative colanic acid biosynthesis glycosyltransferase